MMTKNEILNITLKEAFKLGVKHRKNNKSIHYNPYRNIDLTANSDIATLNNEYIDGWNFENKKTPK